MNSIIGESVEFARFPPALRVHITKVRRKSRGVARDTSEVHVS